MDRLIAEERAIYKAEVKGKRRKVDTSWKWECEKSVFVREYLCVCVVRVIK